MVNSSAGSSAGLIAQSRNSQLLAVLALALLLRVVFYSGYFGSDEVTYVESAFKLLDGDWTVSSYVGANRYGVNLPIAMFAALFGRNEWAAAAYSIVCSLIEILLVATVGRRLVGDRAALIAALLLTVLPTHIHLAGRLMADSPLALTITASFLYFFDGEIRQRPWSYFIAGCAAGFSFWIKQATVFYLLVFILFPLVYRRFNWRWSWMVLGFAFVIGANCLLFQLAANDPLFMFKAMVSRQSSGYLETEAAAGAIDDGPYYYLDHLFRAVHHTWLLGYAAVIGMALYWRAQTARLDGPSSDHPKHGPGMVVFWAVTLILVMSVLVVSWRPLMFIPKQTNYMLMFTSALALLAGCGMSLLRRRTLVIALLVMAVPSVLLAGLHQSVIEAFTANSKAAVAFAASHPTASIYGNANPRRAADFYQMLSPDLARGAVIHPMEDLVGRGPAAKPARPAGVVYAVLDESTLSWASSEPIRRLQDVPSCWIAESRLQPVGLGVVWQVATNWGDWLARQSGPLPKLGLALKARLAPGTAMVFRVPPDCP